MAEIVCRTSTQTRNT